MLKPFLTANWRYLAMLNFAVDPKILAPHVPAGTELDFHNDKTYLSVVGFLFYHTIVCGLPIPRHRNFEEVNLRFYVRKQPVRLAPDTWRRGVVFIRELVPKSPSPSPRASSTASLISPSRCAAKWKTETELCE